MKKLTALVWVCAAVVTLEQLAGAQQAALRKTAAPKATTSEREQDGLNGRVRRVRIETAKIVIKDGKLTEASKVLGGITTYDINGRKIDSVAYPVESSAPSGREQYSYDDNGNIIEMVVRGADGSILTKELYQYEFDELRNWKKMSTSVAVYENGKLSFEPVEVSYRTITYYYDQAIDKLTAASPSKTTSVSLSSASPDAARKRQNVPVAEDPSASEPKIVSTDHATEPQVRSDATESTSKNAAVSPVPVDNTSVKTSSPKTSESAAPVETPSLASNKIPVTHVSEETLRNAALDLPQPEFPLADLGVQNVKVKVEVAVDEKGQVTNARGSSGNHLLDEAAEAAARKAHFSSARLSQNPERVFGVITYEFTQPIKTTAATVPLTGSTEEKQKAAAPTSPTSNSSNNAAVPTSVSANSSNNAAAYDATKAAVTITPSAAPGEESGQFYEHGLTHLMAGRYLEAVTALRQAVDRNPEDALAYLKLGLAYAGLGQHNETIATLKLAIRINPELVDVEGYYRLGDSYTALGKRSESLQALKKAMQIVRAQAVEANPNKYSGVPALPTLHYALGLAYYNTENFKEAMKEFKQASELKPGFAEAHYGMALTYLAFDDVKSAEKEEKILRPLNAHLADKVDAAANTSMILTPGSESVGRRRP